MICENDYELCDNIDPEEIVISGIAGRFPGSNNIKQLKEHLFNKADLLTDKHDRWEFEHSDLPNRIGVINNLNKFDAEFFDISDSQAHVLDSSMRILLELTYEAIVDAGINPKQLRGRNIATVVATCLLESQEILLYKDLKIDGLNIVGCTRATLANLLSHWLDLKGPSYLIDTACSGSISAIALAYYNIISGRCEDAIVAAANLCLHWMPTMHYYRLGILSPSGYCRPFDVNANGYCRSESISVIYLQKAKHAKRIYGLCKHVKLNSDGFKEEGITFPSEHMQTCLLTEFYQECGISPSNVEYVEAHGTATRAGDPPEISAICNVFCKERKTPLLIGSIKSNLGHAEPASGMTQLAKAIITMEGGVIPPMIHFTSPRKDIESIKNGTIRVVTEPTHLTNGYVAINSFGFGGANGHMLVQWNPKTKINNGAPNDDLPRLVTVSGRTEESVKSFLEDIANHPLDVEYIRLLHDIHASNIDGHPWRGYIVLDKTQQRPIKEIQAYKTDERPVWFIFSGVDSQWFGLGSHLLRFSVFARSIKRCDNILRQYDISVTDIMTMIDEKIGKNPLNTLIGIVAFQIGLVDLLTSLGIIPDNIIGYSIGELGCAYADNCLTIDQTLLSAYLIASACVEGTVPSGSMATVNLEYETLKNICPSDVEIACRNTRESNVISGPTKSIHAFMKKLQTNNTHAQEIPCNNIPYHSHYVASIKDKLTRNLNLLITQPKKRSSRWISTSVPSTEWPTPAAQLCSADYLINNILTTVRLDQTIHIIPNNAVTIEIAPISALQYILKESLHPQVTNIALTQRTKEDPVITILQKIGNLYNCGLQPQIAALYPPVKFPVSRGTPMISPSIKWDYSKEWFIRSDVIKRIETRERLVEVSITTEEYEYMKGHVIDGRNLLPAMGYVMLVWETIGMTKGEFYAALPIVFRDLRFIRATNLPKNDAVDLVIRIHKDSGKFEVCEGDNVVVTGEAFIEINIQEETVSSELLSENDKDEEFLNIRDIYKELKLRGYQYNSRFRALSSASITGSKGHAIWIGNWVTFMDLMLQIYILGQDTRSLYVPTSIQKLVIDPVLHKKKLEVYSAGQIYTETKLIEQKVPVRVFKDTSVIVSGGIEISGVKATPIARRKPNTEPVIEEYKFVTHQDRAMISLEEAIRISTQIVLEDHQITNVKAIELVEDIDIVSAEELLSLSMLEAFGDMPLIQANITLITSSNRFDVSALPPNITVTDITRYKDNKILLAAGYNLLTKPQSLEQLLPFLKQGGFILTREKCDVIDHDTYLQQYKLNVILEKRTTKETIVLLKQQVPIRKATIVHVNNDNFAWLENLKSLIADKHDFNAYNRIVVVGEGDFECGLLGFLKCLRKEPSGELVRGVLIQDETAPKFSLQDPFYKQQLQKDLTCNILRSNRSWGSYRHLRLPPAEPKPVPAAYVSQTVRGDLSTFCWIENDISIDSDRDDLIRVVYSAINFRDVMLATGKLTSLGTEGRFDHMFIGLEYAGFDAKGRRVMGIRDNKCIANVVVKSELQWIVPDTWTLEEAATVPCVYSTSYYALYIKGKMKKGDKVLIHSGTGGVGQSAIRLALHEGCEVFTTVGTAEKRQFIKEMFPTIPDNNIGNSHDTSFEQMVVHQTHGRGVDIVLNSLAEEKLLASVRCLARNGRFLEIGKFDLVSDNHLDISLFKKGISFHGVLLDRMMIGEHEHKTQLKKLMSDGLKNGIIKPLEATVFQRSEVEAAFRYMTSGKHMGKILLNIQETDKSTVDEPILAYPRYYCRRDRTYVILGGLGGFGLELTEWLISRGARNVVLTSRRGIKNGYQSMKISLWRSYGVNVIIVKDNNVANPTECEHLLLRAEKESPVDAIFNLAVVLRDCILENQTTETFAESFNAKAWPTQTLDKVSRKICSNLRHFVVFSSVSCGKGNAGQTNYGMANSVMERVCEKRVKEGLPGLAIQWGAVGDVGLVADMQEDDKELVIGGTLPQPISSCLDELEKLLLQNRPIVSSIVVAEKKSVSGVSDVFQAVANIMDIKDAKTVSRNVSLAELGMDSMMAVEIKQTLEREFEIYLTAQEIRNLTLANIIEMSDKSHTSDTIDNKTVVDTNVQDTTNKIYMYGFVQDKDFISEICVDHSTEGKDGITQVFLVPGIDGCGTVFNQLASNIKFPTTTLHYNTGVICASDISEITVCLIQVILPKLQGKKDFVMVGYSFGSILAIELTARLEAAGFTGRIVLIDGAPDQVLMLAKTFVSLPADGAESDDSDFQMHILIGLYEGYNQKINEEVVMEVQQKKTWEERIEIFAKFFLVENSMLSLANLRTLCATVYRHLRIARKYDPSIVPRLTSSGTLLKPTSPSAAETEEDYGLHKIMSNVRIHHVEGNHVTILNSMKVVSAINGEL